MINVSPKVTFTENIKIQSEPRGYSMNTHRRRPWSMCKAVSAHASKITVYVLFLCVIHACGK